MRPASTTSGWPSTTDDHRVPFMFHCGGACTGSLEIESIMYERPLSMLGLEP